MDDPRTDAPEFELTPHSPDEVVGPDALQLNARDAAGLVAPNPFEIIPPLAAYAAVEVKPLKPAKPVTAAANDSVVAALMGRPMSKAGKPAKLAKSATPAKSIAPKKTAITAAAAPVALIAPPAAVATEPVVAAESVVIVAPMNESAAEPVAAPGIGPVVELTVDLTDAVAVDVVDLAAGEIVHPATVDAASTAEVEAVTTAAVDTGAAAVDADGVPARPAVAHAAATVVPVADRAMALDGDRDVAVVEAASATESIHAPLAIEPLAGIESTELTVVAAEPLPKVVPVANAMEPLAVARVVAVVAEPTPPAGTETAPLTAATAVTDATAQAVHSSAEVIADTKADAQSEASAARAAASVVPVIESTSAPVASAAALPTEPVAPQPAARKPAVRPPHKPAKPTVPVPVTQVPPPARPAGASSAAPGGKPRRAIPVVPVWNSEAAAPARPANPGKSSSPAQGLRPPAPAAFAAPGVDVIDYATPATRSTGAWWTIPLMFVGIAIVACAILVPAADENRRDLYELTKIQRDVDYFKAQSDVNVDFLQRVNTDATLAERLAMRQLHETPQGTRIVAAARPDRYGASPYAMTRLDPPAALAPYQPVPDQFSAWFLGEKRPQQMASLGLLVAGAGVLLGGLRKPRVGA